MRNFIWSFLALFCLMPASFSQSKSIEKGTYLSTNKGQTVKLKFLEGNKYELVLSSGEYKVKGDSLLFSQNKKADDAFNVTFKNDRKAKKIKMKFLDTSYYPFYIGTQKGAESVQYQRLSDIKTKVDPEFANADLEFDIDRTDYLYLVVEGYETETKLYKYALPKDVSEVTIKYDFDIVEDLKISGFFDKKSNELKISGPSGKDPIIFLSEKGTPPPPAASNIIAIEKQSISNWTYPGKESLISEDFGSETVDSASPVADSVVYPSFKFDFKFKTENNLKDAIVETKTAKSKFLVISVDSKNPSAKADFDSFLKDQEVQTGYLMPDVYNPEFDLFNYYLANDDDEKWLKANKIKDNPSVIILNSNGDILATVKSGLSDKKTELNYYYNLYKKLQRRNTFYSFNKVIKNKKATDADLILAFNNAAILELSYDYADDEADPADFKLVKVVLDKKEVSQTWKKLIESHQKDTKPNKDLVETILKEIKNQGFYKQFFNEDRVLNDTDFLAIDYLLKHYDAIEKIKNEDETVSALVLFQGSLSAEISSALQQNISLSQEGIAGKANQDRTIAVYKKLIAAGKGSLDCYKNYFAYLGLESENAIDNITYLKEFKSYFNTYLSTEKGNAIERLDEMFAAIDDSSDYSYNGWTLFKDYHSNLANSAAWAVVLKPANASFIKDAINWSEYSLIVTKNNPYYLDTLAQLYYKDGQKDKAITTQELAVKFLNLDVEQTTASEIRETLTKMQNGTY